MKTYTTKRNEDLGSIAHKFGMPSWKYLYQINKDKIGDNPDLLKEGTVLKIPQWDSTGGDEKIKAKGGDPMRYTGGLRYAYPWIPVSISLVDRQGALLADFEGEREYVVGNRDTKVIFCKGTIKRADTIEVLVPAATHLFVGIKGLPIYWDGEISYHPDDEPNITVNPSSDSDAQTSTTTNQAPADESGDVEG